MNRFTKHINPATILALVALVFAVTGGAYAASGSGGNGGGHATANVAKAKKKAPAGKPGPRGPAGPRGAAGAAGAAGPAGAQGPAGPGGAKGENGAPGTNGTNGTNGTDGKDGTNGANAEGASFAGKKTVGSVTCEEGGVEVKSAKPATAVCNGSPWTAGGTLPSGETETGTWDASTTTTGAKHLPVSISFPIPLASSLPESKVHYLNFEETEDSLGSGGCEFEQFTIEAKPVAPKGELCVFTTVEGEGYGEFFFIGNSEATERGAFSSGTFVWFQTPAADEYVGTAGVWAVTAP